MKNRIVVDDWGLSKEINSAILELAKRGTIHRISVMPKEKFCKFRLDELLKEYPNIETSWHFWLPPGRTPVQDVLREQWAWLQDNKLEIIKIEPHRHIHHYPWISGPLIKFAVANNVRTFRLQTNPAQPWSYFGSWIFKMRYELDLDFSPTWQAPIDLGENWLWPANNQECVFHPSKNPQGEDGYPGRLHHFKFLASL